MLANGLTDDGTAQALGWPKARVTARMRLLELPDAAQQMVGAGTIALSSVEQMRAHRSGLTAAAGRSHRLSGRREPVRR
jgi:hypothetical protein